MRRLVFAPTLVGVVLSALCGCSATRTVHEVSQTYEPPLSRPRPVLRSYAESTFDKVWPAVIDTFIDQALPIEAVDRQSGVIVARRPYVLGEDPLELAETGSVRSVVQAVRQEVRQDRAADRSAGEVLATGRVLSSEPLGESFESMDRPRFRLDAVLTVIVRQFEQSTEVRVLVHFDPVDDLRLREGVSSREADAEFLDVRNDPRLPSRIVRPVPVSRGALERAFLDALSKRVMG